MNRRSTSGSMVCPRCGRLISVNAKACMHCGWKNHGLSGFSSLFRNFLHQSGGMVPVVSGVCVALYLISIVIDLSSLTQPQGLFGLLAPSGEALYRMGMTGSYLLRQGRWWTLITAIYLHGGILHILFNIIWLRQLGYMVEELFGTSRAFLIFTLSGVAGYIVSDFLGVMFTVGASGSIFGLLGALIYYGRKRGGYFGAAIYRQVGSWALMAFLFGFLFPGVNNFAHAGGFVGGFLAAMALGFQEFKHERRWHRILAAVAVAVTVASFVLVFVVR